MNSYPIRPFVAGMATAAVFFVLMQLFQAPPAHAGSSWEERQARALEDIAKTLKRCR